MSKRRSIVARTAAGAAVALACAAALSACEPGAEDDPVAATRDFITDGMIDGNGFLACAYLTREQQRAASKRAGGGQCRQAFDSAEFTLGVQTHRHCVRVDHLTADDTLNGNRATVELVSRRRCGRVPRRKADLADFPSRRSSRRRGGTRWRIAQGRLHSSPTAENSAVKHDAQINVR